MEGYETERLEHGERKIMRRRQRKRERKRLGDGERERIRSERKRFGEMEVIRRK